MGVGELREDKISIIDVSAKMIIKELI